LKMKFGDVIHRLTAAHLGWIDRLTRNNPRLVLGCILTAVLLSVISVLTTRFETDIFRLFPADRPALRLLLDSLEWSGGARDAYFLLEGEPQQMALEAERFAARLKGLQVEGKPAFKRIVYRLYDENEARSFIELIAFAAAHPAAFVPPDKAGELARRLQPDAVPGAISQLTEQIAGSIGGFGSQMAIADPLGLRDLILPRLKAGSQALNLDPDSPYLLSRDGRVLIIIAEPVQPMQNMDFARKLVAAINEAREGSAVKISCAGAHISAVIDEAAMKRNIQGCILSSLLVVLGLFYFTYRRLLLTLLIPVNIVVGVLLALGLAGLLLPSIHIISFAFMALIIGLGADYSIHLYDRYHTERASGRSSDEALQLVVLDTGHGLFTTSLTTALPFFVLTISDVRALSELGLLVGLGVLFTLYASIFIVPLALRLTERPERVYRQLPRFGLGWLWRFSGQQVKKIVVVSTVLILMLATAATRTSFDSELKNLQPRHSEAFHAQELIEAHLNLAPRHLLLAVDELTLEAALARSARIEGFVAETVRKMKGSSWSSLGQALNNTEQQQRIIATLGEPLSSALVEKQLLRHGFSLEPFEKYLSQVADGSLNRVVPDKVVLDLLSASPLRGVVERHLVQDKAGWHGLTYLHYQPDQLDLKQFTAELSRLDPKVRLTGMEPVALELLAAVRNSFAIAIVVGGTLVLLLLLAHFKDSIGIFASLGPVAVGIVAMLGTMVLIDMKLNFMNAMVLVTIVGMGSDYGLHIRHQLVQADPAYQQDRFVQVARSVLLSALTTIAGFGSLAFTDYGAMSSMGWATNFGIGFTTLAALVLLPAILQLNAVQRRR